MIYVDTPAWYNNAPIPGLWCHCATDSIDNLDELHIFIESLGLKRSYFQLKNGCMPHYDLYEGKAIGRGKHTQALKKGAVLVEGTELARRCWLNEQGKPYLYTRYTHKRIMTPERERQS